MQISVIIPALNEAEHIAAAVEHARRLEPHEIIVVDGGSTDPTPDIASGLSCRLLTSDRGRARQQNHGARHATGDVLLFLHADSRLPPQAAAQIRRALGNPRIPGGAFRHKIDAPGLLYRMIERGDSFRVRMFGLPYGDQGIFVRRKVFERLGGFPDVPLMEDLLLARRLRRVGRVALLPGPLVTSARRWRRHGVLGQTLRNWLLLAAESWGISPQHLAKYYQPHWEWENGQGVAVDE